MTANENNDNNNKTTKGQKMDEIKHTYYDCDRHSGFGSWASALAIGFVAVGGLALWAGSRKNDGAERYMSAKSQGAMEAGIACNAGGIADIKCQLNQMNLLSNIKSEIANSTCAGINAQNVNQQKTDTGLAVIANAIGQQNALLNKTLGNCFVYSKDICPSTTTTA